MRERPWVTSSGLGSSAARLWGQVFRLERQAYAALEEIEKVEEQAAKFDRAYTPKRLEQHLAAWERLSAGAEEKMARQL